MARQSQPAISIQIAGNFQRALAESLAKRLQANGLAVQGIEDIGKRAPGAPEVRVQGFSDRRIARNLRDASAKVLHMPARLVALNTLAPKNDTYEIWLDAGLCASRAVAGCQAPPSAAPALPTQAPVATATLETSPTADGLNLIARFEGLARKGTLGRQTGQPIIGYGHVLSNDEASSGVVQIGDERVAVGAELTVTQARQLLQADLALSYMMVSRRVTVPLSARQSDALVSFLWNVGSSKFENSNLLKQLNAGHYDAVPDELVRGTTQSNYPRGLRLRREAEAALWRAGSATPALPEDSAKSAVKK